MENNTEVPQKLKRELPYSPEVQHLGIYLKKSKTRIQKDKGSLMFIAALFTTAKIQKQPKCPSTEKNV